jgi:hypothetical protein
MRTYLGRLARFWSVHAPQWLDPWSPQLADALADGAWTSSRLGLTALAPVCALVVGLVARLAMPAQQWSFAESPLFMVVVIAAPIVSGTCGATLLAGYVAGDLVAGVGPRFLQSGPSLQVLVGQIIGYLLLTVPAIAAPRFARSIAGMELFRRRIGFTAFGKRWRLRTRSIVFPLTCAAMVFVWAFGLVVLVRPLYTWQTSSPVETAERLYDQVANHLIGDGIWLAAAALLAGVARVALQDGVARRSSKWTGVLEFNRLRASATKPSAVVPHWMQLPLRIVLPAASITLLLAGAYQTWTDGLLVAAIAAALGVWRHGLIGRLPARIMEPLARIPALVRFISGPMVGYLLRA